MDLGGNKIVRKRNKNTKTLMFHNHMDMDTKTWFSSLCIFFLLTLLSSFNSASSAVIGNETDRLALLDFKAKITHDPLGVMSSWNNSVHFCQWHGVTCGHRHKRVTDLDLRISNLAGSISPHIWNLSFLRGLHLQSNNFHGQLPQEVGRLRRLSMLNLINNSIAGDIPSNLSSCTSLSVIGLAHNKLVGKLPVELGMLKNLQVLVADDNELVGDIPSSFGNLTFLTSLSLATNHLGGAIPPALGQLRYLSFFELGVNRFIGTIPPSIFNLSLIDTFDVQQNQLHGTLPSDLGFTMPNLMFFNILSNHFSGPIPPSISNASNLVHLFLYTNNFTGKVPYMQNLVNLQRLSLTTNHLGSGKANDLSFISSLTNASNLLKLSLNDNNFGGVIPENIGNLSTTLTFLLLDNNQITGKIPCSIGNLVNITRLELWGNKLSGSIPECVGKLKKLEVLFLQNNGFTGRIPNFLGDFLSLNSLDLGRNKLQGSIPPVLGNCQRLMLLDLSVNNISGTIPSKLLTLSSLSIALVLSHNQLSGGLPLEVGNLNNLGLLNVSDNLLSGEIPSSLGSCVRLEVLGMGGNLFNGTIPSSFSSLRGLQSLDLSRNNLSGKIPGFFDGFIGLKDLNLSYNSFVGMVPQEGVFKNSSATSLEGNGMLCGGVSEFHLPECRTKKPKTLKVKYLILAVVSLFLGALVAFGAVFFCCLKKKNNRTASSILENSMFQMSYRTLFEATDGFSSANLIGKGGFGSVYRGSLDDENLVAVKVFNVLKRGASKSFSAECAALRNIRHRNLVKVVTACSSIDGQGNDFKAIVYEFMVNGSLDDWLHQVPPSTQVTRKLSFLQRLNMAIDVAAALDYLHNQFHTTIVHCDLKPSNVLLDDDMTAHVSDFGLMKFFSDDSPANHENSTGVRGTVGYTAPEYGMGSEVSTLGDMYSYGILLLEMFTGRRPTDDMFDANTNLRSYVKKAEVEEVADPTLVQETKDDETDIETVKESLVLIFGIGVACSEEMPRERMDIRDASAKLVVIRDKLIRNGNKTCDKKASEKLYSTY